MSKTGTEQSISGMEKTGCTLLFYLTYTFYICIYIYIKIKTYTQKVKSEVTLWRKVCGFTLIKYSG